MIQLKLILSVLILGLLFSGCSTSYRVSANHAHLYFGNNKGQLGTPLFYANDSLGLNFHLYTTSFASEDELKLGSLNKVQRRNLSLARVDKHKDQVFYASNAFMLLLRDSSKITLHKYVADEVLDSVIYRAYFALHQNTPSSQYVYQHVSFFRHAQIVIIENLIPYKGKYLSYISCLMPDVKQGNNSACNPADPNNAIVVGNACEGDVKIMRENAKRILREGASRK